MRCLALVLLTSVVVACTPPTPGPGPLSFTASAPDGTPVLLTGIISKPERGDGPFAAAVLLPSCEGISPHRDDPWVERLNAWGFVTLQVDSFTLRGYKDGICQAPAAVTPTLRARDAHAAKALLAELPYVDPERIVLVGWAHGAWSTLIALSETPSLGGEETLADDAEPGSEETPVEQEAYVPPFRAGVAFYPWCEPATTIYVPLLILSGELDDWTPPYRCIKMKELSPAEIVVEIYSGAYHDFDVRGRDKLFEGRRLKFDQAATEEATQVMEEFLRFQIN